MHDLLLLVSQLFGLGEVGHCNYYDSAVIVVFLDKAQNREKPYNLQIKPPPTYLLFI